MLRTILSVAGAGLILLGIFGGQPLDDFAGKIFGHSNATASLPADGAIIVDNALVAEEPTSAAKIESAITDLTQGEVAVVKPVVIETVEPTENLLAEADLELAEVEVGQVDLSQADLSQVELSQVDQAQLQLTEAELAETDPATNVQALPETNPEVVAPEVAANVTPEIAEPNPVESTNTESQPAELLASIEGEAEQVGGVVIAKAADFTETASTRLEIPQPEDVEQGTKVAITAEIPAVAAEPQEDVPQLPKAAAAQAAQLTAEKQKEVEQLLAGNGIEVVQEILVVVKDKVNLRAGPSIDHEVVLLLEEGHELMEFKREGNWVNVGAYGTSGKIGWVHQRLVGPR